MASCPSYCKSQTTKPLGRDDVPDLKESNLIISILRTDSARITITHLSIPIISQFVQALCHYEAKWSMKRNECVRLCPCVFVYVGESKREEDMCECVFERAEQ